jgi:hypothetical protein
LGIGNVAELRSPPEAADQRLIQLYIIVDPGGSALVSDQNLLVMKGGPDQEE